MVLALDASMSGIGRRAARFSPLRLLLLKTAIPATASCVHEMDTFCKLAGAVGIELLAALQTRKLLILGNAKRMKNRKNAEPRYTRGTKKNGPEASRKWYPLVHRGAAFEARLPS